MAIRVSLCLLALLACPLGATAQPAPNVVTGAAG